MPGRILVVDDEPLVAACIERLLLDEQHEVVCATRAEDALARVLGGERFDLILCDLMMPDMTGIDLHAALVGHDPTLAARMVFLTGGATTPRSRAFVATVADRIVDKPFDPDQLLSMINQRVR